MYKRAGLLTLALLSAAVSVSADSADPKRYIEDIKVLTTPAMEGRGHGTPGLTRAATLIEQLFRALGLQPAGENSYLQPFTVTWGKLK